eukprot:scaffold14792_cov146-Isochrysis_galbana.AAC.1
MIFCFVFQAQQGQKSGTSRGCIALNLIFTISPPTKNGNLDLRKELFPLHFIVFKQCASHLHHEASVEQVFSLAKRVSDPNLDPNHLACTTWWRGGGGEEKKKGRPHIRHTQAPKKGVGMRGHPDR